MRQQKTLHWMLAALPVVALVALAFWSFIAQRIERDAVPTDAEWAAARQIVRDGYQPGDVVRTAPSWADQGRIGLFDVEFNLTLTAEEPELFHYDRLWIIADAEHVDEAVERLPEGYTVQERWTPSERTAVVLVDIPEPTHVKYDFVSHVAEATVSRDQGGQRDPCEIFHQGGWYCADINPWLHVSPMEQETGGTLHRCIYVGLQPDGETRIEWHGLELGATIDGNIGNTMPSIRADRGSDVRFRIEVDGRVRHQMQWGKWDTPFFSFEVDTRDLQEGLHDVAFVLDADDFYDRWVCFRARILR